MESLSWSQSVSPRIPLSSMTGSTQLSVLGTLDFAALLNSSEHILNLPASVAETQSSRDNLAYLSRDTESTPLSTQEPKDSTGQSVPSGSAESSQPAEETDERDKEAENGSETASASIQLKTSPNDNQPIKTATEFETATDTEPVKSQSANGRIDENSNADPNRTHEVENDLNKRELLSEKIVSQQGKEQRSRPESAEHGFPAPQSNDLHPEYHQPVAASKDGKFDMPATVVTANAEDTAFEINPVLVGNEAAESLAEQEAISADMTAQQTLNEQIHREPIRDIRGTGNRRSKALRWFERSDSLQLKAASKPSASANSESMLVESGSIKSGIAGSSKTTNGLKQSEDSQSILPSESEQFGASAMDAVLPSQLSYEQLESLVPSFSTLQSGSGTMSGPQPGSDVQGQIAQPSSATELLDTRGNDPSGASERVLPGSKTGQYESHDAGNPAMSALNSSDSNSNLVRAERLRMIQRVARSFHRLSANGGSIQLRLHPPELGSLSMQVQLEGRNMTARLTTETATAREIILDSLPQLRERLADQGYEVMQITVDVADQNSAGGSGGSSTFTRSNNENDSHWRESQAAAMELRRSALQRRQSGSEPLTANPLQPRTFLGIRGIDLHV